MVDKIYTPHQIADQLSSIAEKYLDIVPKLIADFACGDGRLLKSAKEIWDGSLYLANDLDINALKNVEWCEYKYNENFMDYKRSFNSFFRIVDLILLNPPFSHRPSVYVEYKTNIGVSTKCSPAMSFILNSIDFLSKDGVLIGIFPDSVLWSQKDEAAREHIKFMGYKIEQVHKLKSSLFDGYTVNTSILCVRRSDTIFPVKLNTENGHSDLIIGRGTLQVHKSNNLRSNNRKHPKYIHTTNLKDGRLDSNTFRVASSSIIKPPFLTIPRVGKPSAGKIIIVERGSYILSDCIIYIKSDKGNLETIKDYVIENIQNFYGGSCAKYTTIKVVSKELRKV